MNAKFSAEASKETFATYHWCTTSLNFSPSQYTLIIAYIYIYIYKCMYIYICIQYTCICGWKILFKHNIYIDTYLYTMNINEYTYVPVYHIPQKSTNRWQLQESASDTVVQPAGAVSFAEIGRKSPNPMGRTKSWVVYLPLFNKYKQILKKKNRNLRCLLHDFWKPNWISSATGVPMILKEILHKLNFKSCTKSARDFHKHKTYIPENEQMDTQNNGFGKGGSFFLIWPPLVFMFNFWGVLCLVNCNHLIITMHATWKNPWILGHLWQTASDKEVNCHLRWVRQRTSLGILKPQSLRNFMHKYPNVL